MSDKLKSVIAYLIDVKKVSNMTPKKLQKMLYYCYAWHLALTAENAEISEIENSKLFNESFEAWVHGPVIKKVYDKYKNFRNKEIDSSGFEFDSKMLTGDELGTIDEVIEVYGEFNGNELESISHAEDPWIEAREGKRALDICTNKLSDVTIFKYYVSRMD